MHDEVNIIAAYSEGRVVISRPGDWPHSLRFFILSFGPSRQVSGFYLKLGHDRLLPYPFKMIFATRVS